MKYYVYIHYKEDDDTPFYVGKGCGRRAFRKVGRSVWWNRIVSKHGLRVRVINFFSDEASAFNAESDIIQYLGSRFVLCNFTKGGEGVSGYKQKPETVIKRMESYAKTRLSRPIPFPPQAGSQNFNFKGSIQATCLLSGRTFLMTGGQDIEAHGFNKSAVYKCATGVRRTYRKHTFERMPA